MLHHIALTHTAFIAHGHSCLETLSCSLSPALYFCLLSPFSSTILSTSTFYLSRLLTVYFLSVLFFSVFVSSVSLESVTISQCLKPSLPTSCFFYFFSNLCLVIFCPWLIQYFPFLSVLFLNLLSPHMVFTISVTGVKWHNFGWPNVIIALCHVYYFWCTE